MTKEKTLKNSHYWIRPIVIDQASEFDYSGYRHAKY